jgi:hypothetical protein
MKPSTLNLNLRVKYDLALKQIDKVTKAAEILNKEMEKLKASENEIEIIYTIREDDNIKLWIKVYILLTIVSCSLIIAYLCF